VLVRRFEKKLYMFVFGIVKREDDAKDVVQDTFIRVYEHVDRFDVRRNFSAYLYASAKNEAISLLRKRKHSVSLEDIELVDEKQKPEEALMTKSTNEALHRAIGTLDGKYQRVVRLYYFHDLSYEEIAHRLSLPLNTVRTYLRRAKIQLKSLLAHEKH
jgi:RNA polymerase sigma factor (sigma-70 family)